MINWIKQGDENYHYKAKIDGYKLYVKMIEGYCKYTVLSPVTDKGFDIMQSNKPLTLEQAKEAAEKAYHEHLKKDTK